MDVSKEFTYDFAKDYVKKKKNPHRIYSPGFHSLVGTLHKKWQKRSELYEMCITIAPKSKHYDEDPEQQYTALRAFIKCETSKRNIDHITAYEFSKKGALHTHMLLRSSTGYQRPLQLLRNMAQRKFGRTSLSLVNNFLNYFTYMVKGLGMEGFNLDIRQMRASVTKDAMLLQKKRDAFALKNEKMLQQISACKMQLGEDYHIPKSIYGKIYKYIDAKPAYTDLLKEERAKRLARMEKDKEVKSTGNITLANRDT